MALELHSATLAPISTHRYTDTRNHGAGIMVGHNRYAASKGSPAYGVALVTASGHYYVVKHWATEQEARAHANRIHADKVAHGSLAGIINVPS